MELEEVLPAPPDDEAHTEKTPTTRRVSASELTAAQRSASATQQGGEHAGGDGGAGGSRGGADGLGVTPREAHAASPPGAPRGGAAGGGAGTPAAARRLLSIVGLPAAPRTATATAQHQRLGLNEERMERERRGENGAGELEGEGRDDGGTAAEVLAAEIVMRLQLLDNVDIDGFMLSNGGVDTCDVLPSELGMPTAELLVIAFTMMTSQDNARKRRGARFFFMMPGLLFIRRGEEQSSGDWKRELLRRVDKLKAGGIAELLEDELSNRPERAAKAAARREGEEASVNRVLKLTAANQLSRAAERIDSPGVAPPTLVSLEKMKQKHPKPQRQTYADEWSNARVAAAEKVAGMGGRDIADVQWHDLKTAIQTTKPHTSPGISGWHAEFFKLAISKAGPFAGMLEDVFPKVASMIMRGDVPPEFLKLLRGGYLVALNKGNAADDVRPIVVGELLLKIVERYALGQVIEEMAAMFEDERQYGGAGVKGGQEAAVHVALLQLSRAAKRAYEEQGEAWGIMATDVSNAFNEVSRPAIARATLKFLPSLMPLVSSMYSTSSELYFRVKGQAMPSIVWSLTGVRQGSPLSSLLFDLVYLTVTRAVRLACGDEGDIVGNHDDLHILGTARALAQGQAAMKKELEPIHLRSNEGKGSLWIPEMSADGSLAETGVVDNAPFHAMRLHVVQEPDGVRRAGERAGDVAATTAVFDRQQAAAEEQGFTMLKAGKGVPLCGAAVGDSQYTEAVLDGILAKTERLADAIVEKVASQHLQSGAILHRACLPSRVMHVMRAMPPKVTQRRFAGAFDNVAPSTRGARELQADAEAG